MSAAQWTVPIVLGLLGAGLTFVAVPDEMPGRRDAQAAVRSDAPYVLVPSVDDEASLLRHGADTTRHGLGGIMDIHAGRLSDGVFWWDGNGWECHRPGASCTPGTEPVAVRWPYATDAADRAPSAEATTHGGDPGGTVDAADPSGNGTSDAADGSGNDTSDAADPSGNGTSDAGDADGNGTGLGDDGNHGTTVPATVTSMHATVNLTFYMFTSSGHLLATNAPRSAWEHFDLHGQFSRFSGTTWHLGAGEAPAGARTLPMFRDQAFALLAGTPVGGVRSSVLEEHPYDWLLGPVWATARVEAIVGAG